MVLKIEGNRNTSERDSLQAMVLIQQETPNTSERYRVKLGMVLKIQRIHAFSKVTSKYVYRKMRRRTRRGGRTLQE